MIKSKSATIGANDATTHATAHATTVTFSLEYDRPVSVVGDFNGWNPESHPMQRVGTEYLVSIDLLPGRYAFRYLADGGMFFDDPDSTIESNGYGGTHSVVEVVAAPKAEPVIELNAHGATVVIATAPTDSANDLTVIAGLGPKANAALIAGGVTTFSQLAKLTSDELKAILATASIRFIPAMATWSAQATSLAAAAVETAKTVKTVKTTTKKLASTAKR